MKSTSASAKFHNTIGKHGLSSMSKRQWDRAILKQLEKFIEKNQKILDIGCGYGRIAIPLLDKGYDLYGIDISRGYINELRRGLSNVSLRRRFRVADMCDLPFQDKSFDVALCLWSAFDELLFRKEQVKALKEMKRVLKPAGFAFIEGLTYTETMPHEMREGKVGGHQKRIRRDYSCDGLQYCHYNHDEESLKRALGRAGIKDYTISVEWFGWRERLIVRFRK